MVWPDDQVKTASVALPQTMSQIHLLEQMNTFMNANDDTLTNRLAVF